MCVVVFVFVVVALFSLLFLHTLLTFLHSFPTSHLLIYLLPSWFRFFWCTKRCWRTASLPFCFPTGFLYQTPPTVYSTCGSCH
ncbi:hypothetical protein BDQ17DRAFT_1381712 [Cyathus striatus]|nr:hypothetical protein BDQ17DRAFT_1382678 [Cyathus striatus]KAF8979419.1 hypothetical protein BDQ17DRAFT_1381712 [Cyathus striatus]